MRNLTYKPFSLMGYSKDTVTNQVSSSTYLQVVKTVVQPNVFTHIENATPADTSISGESPLSVRNYIKMMVQHHIDQGIKTTWRNTWADFEGLYGKSKLVGASRILVGTVGSAPTDGTTTWYGRVHEFFTDMYNYVQNGDDVGIFPEATGHGILIGDSTSFLPANVQTNYNSFFVNMRTVVANALSGKSVTFDPAQNYSEYASSWLLNAIPNDQNCLSIDHYGLLHTAAEMDADLRARYAQFSKILRQKEYGDYWNTGLNDYDRLFFLKTIYNVWTTLGNEGKCDTFGYWRGAVNDLEGVFESKPGGGVQWNKRGKLLIAALSNNGLTRMPIL